MPQDVDGSGLISLLWAAWVYWWVYRWLDHLSSLEQSDDKHREHSRPRPSGRSSLIAPLPNGTVTQKLEATVSEILRRDGAASLDEFLANALAAYETVVAAFDAGDRDRLRALVSTEVYETFSDAIAARETRRESLETVFSRIEPPEIVEAVIEGTRMEVSIRFVCEMFRLSRNAAGQVVGGREGRCRCIDIWTFDRALSPGNAAWRLVATRAGA